MALNVFPKLGREIPDEWYRRPVYYKGSPPAIGAHDQDVSIPSYAERLDLEFEFAVIVGREGSTSPKRIPSPTSSATPCTTTSRHGRSSRRR
jgi:2-keto-4-pentenoate hydratase/2-oxohepta-3-ene-1,7-dioic acid hydratase in catechol pathway